MNAQGGQKYMKVQEIYIFSPFLEQNIIMIMAVFVECGTPKAEERRDKNKNTTFLCMFYTCDSFFPILIFIKCNFRRNIMNRLSRRQFYGRLKRGGEQSVYKKHVKCNCNTVIFFGLSRAVFNSLL